MLDPVALTQALIRCPSITPQDAGALDLLDGTLEELGFRCQRQTFIQDGTAPVDNLFARLGDGGPHLCFAGHTDVVPAGAPERWSADPFAAEIRDGRLIGRGAVDMKGAIACFVAAVARFIDRAGNDFQGSISLLITGDEEGPSINGTRKMLDWVIEQGHRLDDCLVGEPTNPDTMGQMYKIGRRGSLNGHLVVHGRQGHAAYPHKADNPVHRILKMLDSIASTPMDHGNDHFQPTGIQVTSVDTGNPTTNVIPGRVEARFNVRFNDMQTSKSVETWLRHRFDSFGGEYDLTIAITGESFLTTPGRLNTVIPEAVEQITGMTPEASTSGGTSDARFIRTHCPVAEFGLISATAHQVDESIAVNDLHLLTDIYADIIHRYFARP